MKNLLEINGVGYRAAVNGKVLNLQLGFSHPIDYDIPEGLEMKVEKNIIHLSKVQTNKLLVKQQQKLDHSDHLSHTRVKV